MSLRSHSWLVVEPVSEHVLTPDLGPSLLLVTSAWGWGGTAGEGGHEQGGGGSLRSKELKQLAV